MKDCHFISIWREEKPKGNFVRPNYHAYYELVYYVTGGGHTLIGEESFDFTADNFVIIPPMVEHQELLSATSDIICLAFSCDMPLPISLRHDHTRTFLTILETIVEECTDQELHYTAMVDAKLRELIIYLSRDTTLCKVKNKNVEHIVKYIDGNYHEKISMTDCARQVQMSYSHFQNKFRETTGYSPQTYLLKKRLSAAKHLLMQSDLNCTEIAQRCGFSTSAQFSLLFKNHYGLSPSAYRGKRKAETH